MFSKDGPNLINPEVTRRPNVIPKIYKLKSKNNKGSPKLKNRNPKKRHCN